MTKSRRCFNPFGMYHSPTSLPSSSTEGRSLAVQTPPPALCTFLWGIFFNLFIILLLLLLFICFYCLFLCKCEVVSKVLRSLKKLNMHSAPIQKDERTFSLFVQLIIPSSIHTPTIFPIPFTFFKQIGRAHV